MQIDMEKVVSTREVLTSFKTVRERLPDEEYLFVLNGRKAEMVLVEPIYFEKLISEIKPRNWKSIECLLLAKEIISEVQSKGLHEIARLRDLFYSYYNEFTKEEIVALLDIYEDVLMRSIIPDEPEWAKKNGSYFAGNCAFDKKWQKLFASGSYGLLDVIGLVQVITQTPTRNNVDFALRVAEVTIRDDVRFDRKIYTQEVLVETYVQRIQSIVGA